MSRKTIIALSLLSALVIGGFLVLPKYQDLATTRLEIGKKRTELQYKEKYFSDLEKVSEELKGYTLELSKIDSALPPDPSLPSLFDFLQKAAAQSGLVLKNLSSFSITTSEKEPQIKEVHLDISLSGSYPSFRNFLSALEKTSRLIEVENISLSAPKEKEIHSSFGLRIKTHSY